LKKFLSILAVALLLVFMGTFVFAEGENPITIQINGEVKTPEVEPFITEGTTMVPLRFVVEALGKEVEWEGTEKKITIIDEKSEPNLTINMFIGKAEYTGDKEGALAIAPLIKEGRTFVPLRAIAEIFGSEVDWDGETRTVIIKDKEEVKEKTEEEKTRELLEQNEDLSEFIIERLTFPTDKKVLDGELRDKDHPLYKKAEEERKALIEKVLKKDYTLYGGDKKEGEKTYSFFVYEKPDYNITIYKNQTEEDMKNLYKKYPSIALIHGDEIQDVFMSYSITIKKN